MTWKFFVPRLGPCGIEGTKWSMNPFALLHPKSRGLRSKPMRITKELWLYTK